MGLREEPDEYLKKANKKNKAIHTILFLFVLVILLAVVIIFVRRFIKKREQAKADFSSVDKICELATLRCYYHDVAEYKKEPDGLFKYGLFKYGYKKFWIEYDGIVEIGINVGKVKVHPPDKKGVVKVYVPEAEILNITADKNTMSDPIVETGKLTSITADEKAKAFSKAQETMRKKAESDETLLSQAHNNAKILLEQYIVNVGEEIDQKYTIEWQDEY